MEDIEKIDGELAKANITDQVIEQMKSDYMGLTIKDRTDNAGFDAVTSARKKVKAFRVSVEKFAKDLRNPAFVFQKAVIAKEKEIVGRIAEVEDYLEAQEEIFNPKVMEEEFKPSDEQKILMYVQGLLNVKVPIMETPKGIEDLQKVTSRLNLIGVDII